METINYKGCEIVAKPKQLTDGTWKLSITITEHHGNQTISKGFSASNTFHNREEAVHHCFEFGKRVTDGEVTGWSAEKPH